MELLSLPQLPVSGDDFSAVVRAFDKMRYEATLRSGLDEFCWFAREYPRCYRHHYEHAQFRLESIYENYRSFHGQIGSHLTSLNGDRGAIYSYTDQTVKIIYWDFEAYLAAIGSALDILSRLVGLAYEEQTPPSFNKLCAKDHLGGPVTILRQAKEHWVSTLKDYRDCFVHYTPIETLLTILVVRYSDGYELRCRLPVNPNVRDILGFRYSRRVELLKYGITVYRHALALDRKIASEILRMYKRQEFPRRTEHLFFVGSRFRS